MLSKEGTEANEKTGGTKFTCSQIIREKLKNFPIGDQ